MSRQDLAYSITVNDAQLRLATQHVAAFNAELQASTVTGQKLDESFRAVGRRAAQTGAFFTRNVTLPLALVGVAAGKMSADFERSLAKIQGLTQTGAADTQRLGKAALELGSTTITAGPASLTDAMFKLRSVGFNVSQVIKAMPSLAKASAVGLGSVATVADAVASALDAYGIAGQNAGRNVLTASQATAVLLGTVTAGKIAPEELAKSLGRVIPVANALGISFDQVGASIASITRQQGSANLAVTGLRALLSQLERAQPQTQRALASIGTGPEAVLEALKNPKIGLFPTLIALRQEIEKTRGKALPAFDAKTLAGGLTGTASATAKIKAEVGGADSALSKLFPNIRALTAFLIITGTRKNQNQTIFSALSDDIQHSQDVIKRAYEAKIKTPIGQLELQLSKLKTVGTDLGGGFVQAGAGFLKFVNSLVSAGTGINGFFQKLGPLQHLVRDLGVGLLLFGPVTAIFGRLAQAASLGLTMWGRWQAAALKTAVAIQGINVDEDKALIAHRKATFQFVEGFNSVTASADRAAVAAGRVGAASGLGVRGGIAAATGGTALLTKTTGGRNLSRGGPTAPESEMSIPPIVPVPLSAMPQMRDVNPLIDKQMTATQRQAKRDLIAANRDLKTSELQVTQAVKTGQAPAILYAKAQRDIAAAGVQQAQTNMRLLVPTDARLVALDAELAESQGVLAFARRNGMGIQLAQQRVERAETAITIRQNELIGLEIKLREQAAYAATLQGAAIERLNALKINAAIPARTTNAAASEAGLLGANALLTQQRATIAASEAEKLKAPARIMGTNFGAAVTGMRSTAKLGFDFIALTFAANLVGKVIFDSHKTKDAVTHDLFDIRKAGVGVAAALGVAGLGLAGFTAKAGGLTKVGAALAESGIGAALLQNKLRLAAAALIGLQFAGVKTETIFNAAMVGMLARTVALRLGIVEAGAAFGPWGIAIAAAVTTILASTGALKKGFADVKEELLNIAHGNPFKDDLKSDVFGQVGAKLTEAAKSGKLADTNIGNMRKRLLELGDSTQVDALISKLRALKNAAGGGNSVDDTLFKQLEGGLSRTGKVGKIVADAQLARAQGKEKVAEQLLQSAQQQQLQVDSVRASAFLKSHGQDQLASELFPVSQQIKQAKQQFTTLFSEIQTSLDNAFQARTDRMLDSFDQKTQDVLDTFDAKTQKLEDNLRVKVKLPKLHETFTLSVSGKTPAERELDALDKIQQKQTYERDIFDARQNLATTFQTGDPNAIRDAERKLQDAQTEKRKYGLDQRATAERTAADKSIKLGQQGLSESRKRERQAIDDSRQTLRRNLEASRTIEQQNLDAALKGQAALFQNGKESLNTYQTNVEKIMRGFNITIANAGRDGGQAYATQMQKYFTQLQDFVTKSTTKMGSDADKLSDKLSSRALELRSLAANLKFLGLDAVAQPGVPGVTPATGLGVAGASLNPTTLGKIASGVPTRAAIISVLQAMNGGVDYARYNQFIPKPGRPTEKEYQGFLGHISDASVRKEVQARLRAGGFIGANSGAVVPGSGNSDTVPAMLTPGEIVFNRRHQRTLGKALGMPGAGPHTLFDEIDRPQRFATGGVVKTKARKDEPLPVAIRRMQGERYSTSQIQGQVEKWHPNWPIARVLNAIQDATKVMTTYGKNTGLGAIARATHGRASFDVDPFPQVGVDLRRLFVNDRSFNEFRKQLVGGIVDPLGIFHTTQAAVEFSKRPAPGAGIGLALGLLGLAPSAGGALRGIRPGATGAFRSAIEKLAEAKVANLPKLKHLLGDEHGQLGLGVHAKLAKFNKYQRGYRSLDKVLHRMGAEDVGWRMNLKKGEEFTSAVSRPGEPPRLITKRKDAYGLTDVAGTEHPPSHLFRSISEEEYQVAKRRGYFQSDGRMNLDAREGTVAALSDPSYYLPGKLNSSKPGVHQGRIIRIRYNDADGWRLDHDGYVKTNDPIPFSRVDLAPRIDTVRDARGRTHYQVNALDRLRMHPLVKDESGHLGVGRFVVDRDTEHGRIPYLVDEAGHFWMGRPGEHHFNVLRDKKLSGTLGDYAQGDVNFLFDPKTSRSDLTVQPAIGRFHPDEHTANNWRQPPSIALRRAARRSLDTNLLANAQSDRFGQLDRFANQPGRTRRAFNALKDESGQLFLGGRKDLREMQVQADPFAGVEAARIRSVSGGRFAVQFVRADQSTTSTYFNSEEKAQAFVDHMLARSKKVALIFQKNKKAAGGVIPGMGNKDTVPALLTPGELVLNRKHQRGLASRLGMDGASPGALFSAIAQRFKDGGLVRPQTGTAYVSSPTSDKVSPPGPLPTLKIPGLGDLTDAMQKLVKLMAKNAISADSQSSPAIQKAMDELTIGGHLDKNGKLIRDSGKKLAQLRKQFDPASATSELRATVPGFGSLSGDAKRRAEAIVAQAMAHPVTSNLFTPHANTGDTVGGTRAIRASQPIAATAFASPSAGGTSFRDINIYVDGAGKDERQIAQEVAREFGRLSTHTVTPKRGGYAGRR